MRCPACSEGETSPGPISVPMRIGDDQVLITNVPGEVCPRCGRSFRDASVREEQLLDLASEAIGTGELVADYVAPR